MLTNHFVVDGVVIRSYSHPSALVGCEKWAIDNGYEVVSRETHILYVKSPGTMSRRGKGVVRSDGLYFHDCEDAARFMDANPKGSTAIMWCCYGVRHTAWGYKWFFYPRKNAHKKKA